MMTNQAIRRAMTRTFGIAAAATMMLSLATAAQALSLSNPGMAPATKQMRDAVTTQVRHGAGGFRGAGHAFHGGRFRAAAPAFHGSGFRHRPASLAEVSAMEDQLSRGAVFMRQPIMATAVTFIAIVISGHDITAMSRATITGHAASAA